MSIKGKLVLAILALVVSSGVLTAAAADRFQQPSLLLAAAIGSFLSVLAVSYIFRSVSDALREQRLAAEHLREVSGRLYTLVDAIPEPVFFKDREGRFLAVNEALARWTGKDKGEIVGRRDVEVLPEELAARCRESDGRVLASGEVVRSQTSFASPSGGRLTVDTLKAPITDGRCGVTGLVGIMRDVTEIHRLEAQLRHSQKMEAVGRLAGGVAHDINNYLGAITGYCEHLKISRAWDEGIVRRMEAIIDVSYKASSLIRQLLAFSRKQPMRFDPVSLNDLADRMGTMAQRLLGEAVSLRFSLAEGLWSVRADPDQIEQVLLNLLVNAKDAMPEQGTILVRTANVDLPNPASVNPVMKPGTYVLLSVADDGVGMAPEVRDKIFEPFFTTKEKGRGTGLGLSTAYGIVKQHGGYIWVRSDPGRGTTFDIYLPRTNEKAVDVGEARVRAHGIADVRGEGRILLVEDNPDVRDAVRALLTAMGYTVVDAASGPEALDALHGGPIDLLITDVVMPGMGGVEVAHRVRERTGGTRVLYISGYADGTIEKHVSIDGTAAFLQKPFSANVLGRKVKELLAQPAVGSA